MGFKCGIVGLPNVGKSTLFNALTNSSKAQAANFPFCTIDPNIGIVPVPDSRLNNLAKISKSKKTINTTISFVDIAGLVKGPVISKQIIVRETGSITGSIDGDHIEVHGHMDGKISGDNVVIGSSGTVKGDIDFGNNLKTENGADIDGYIKKTNTVKSKLSTDFLFSKSKDEKKSKENNGSETVVNKESEAIV